MSRNGMTWNFTYGPDGMRTSRSNGTTTWKYTYNGSQLMAMTSGSTKMYFTYDAAGRPVSIKYNGTTYYYVLNAQGDVVMLVNFNCTPVAAYTYDAWGKLCRTTGSMASTLGIYNPLRYRGYVYDVDTGLYYLQSRYYNPEMGRFINADSYVSTGQGIIGNNMFAYCNNNPVCNIDPTGEFAISLTTISIILGAVIGAIAGGVIAHELSEGSSAGENATINNTIAGVVIGGVVGAGAGVAGAAAATAITGIVGLSITSYHVLPIMGTTILGSYPHYIDAAKATASSFYSIPDSLWKSLTADQRWTNNEQFMRDANALGSKFVIYSEQVVKTVKTLWKELQFLLENGIPWEVF